jgi:uncharacterized membrane protein (UPF0127 family)
MIFRLILLSLLLSSPLTSAQQCHVTPGWDTMSEGEVLLERSGETLSLAIRIADGARERAAGYQWICERDALNTAVLFVFPKMINSTFHMRNVYTPLDIYFFDDTGNQVGAMVMRSEPPGQGLDPQYYQPGGAFRYALEIARPQTHQLNSTPAPMRLLIDSL